MTYILEIPNITNIGQLKSERIHNMTDNQGTCFLNRGGNARKF